MSTTQKKYVSLSKLAKYNELLQTKMATDIAAAEAAAKAHADSLASNYDAAGTAATKAGEALASANTYTDEKVKALADGAVKTNADAISAIKDGTAIDSFADVEAALEGKQAVGDYATKSEAQGYANAKDGAIAEAKAAGDSAQETANANAQAIEAINHAESGILAQAKKFASEEDVKVQANIDALANKVGTVPEGSTVMGIITNIQENAYDDTEIQKEIDEVSGKVTTLVGEDANKSVRTIANEELAKQLVAEGAQESLDTLAEIAAWIQAHPADASAMNEAIVALQNKVDTGDKNVSVYVADAIAALSIGDYAKAAELTALAGRVSTLETDAKTHALKTEVEAVSTALTQYQNAHAGDYTNKQIDDAIKVVADDVASLGDTYATDAELAQAVADVKTDASNKDAVVLAEAQKASTAVQTALDTHTGNADIHVTAEQKTAWTTAAGKAHEHGNIQVLNGITSDKITEWDKVSAKADATALQAESERAVAKENELSAAIAAFVECSETEIAELFQ